MYNLVESAFIDAVEIPSEVKSYPAMLGPGDRSLYYLAARDFYKFQGRIVDAGVFLGGTTNCLAQGVKDNKLFDGNFDRKISVYDRFLVGEEAYQSFINKNTGELLEYSSSFRPIFDRLMAKHSDMIEVDEGDFMEKSYPYHFIEILGLDLCKNKDLTAKASLEFFPKLRPYKSVVLHQDYVHIWQPWIAVSMNALKNFFVKSAEIDICGLFTCTNVVSRSQLEEIFSVAFEPGNALKHMQETVNNAQTERARFTLELARIKLMIDFDEMRMARAALDAITLHGVAGAKIRKGDRHGKDYEHIEAYFSDREPNL